MKSKRASQISFPVIRLTTISDSSGIGEDGPQAQPLQYNLRQTSSRDGFRSGLLNRRNRGRLSTGVGPGSCHMGIQRARKLSVDIDKHVYGSIVLLILTSHLGLLVGDPMWLPEHRDHI